MGEVKVSILCTVYNHEKYLRETLEGFVSQKTNFVFEALVHDDASTDNSASIIREYEQKYPDIIKPIYQTENQYSKGRKISLNILVPKAKGQYIAICEGDDCWIDTNKLQRQYDLLEERQDVDICAHNAEVRYDSHYCGQTHITNSEMEVIPFEDIVNGVRGFIPTMSVMIRANVFGRPESSFLQIKCYDETIFIAGSLRGGMLALSDVMSAYHIFVAGSWTARNLQSKGDNFIQGLKKYVQVLEKLNQSANFAYDSILNRRIKLVKNQIFNHISNYAEFIKDPWFKTLETKDKIRIWLSCFHLGWLVKRLSYLKRTIFSLFIPKEAPHNEERSRQQFRSPFNAPFLPCEIPEYFFGYGTYPPVDSNDIITQ